MNAVQSPLALDLANETRKAVAPEEFINDTMRREKGLNELQNFMNRQRQISAQKAAQKTAEDILISAFQNNFPIEAVEVIRQRAGITESRLAELKEQAQM